MKILKLPDRQVFTERFTNKQDCYEFLAELKWSEGYACKRCNSNGFIKGKQKLCANRSNSFYLHVKSKN